MARVAWIGHRKRVVENTVTADLTAATGTADGTVADVGGSFNQTTLNNNFKDLAVAVNEIKAILRAGKY
jgi:hypothetical protein